MSIADLFWKKGRSELGYQSQSNQIGLVHLTTVILIQVIDTFFFFFRIQVIFNKK